MFFSNKWKNYKTGRAAYMFVVKFIHKAKNFEISSEHNVCNLDIKLQ